MKVTEKDREAARYVWDVVRKTEGFVVAEHTIAEALAAAYRRGLEDAAKVVPTNWCDPMLTGPSKVQIPNCPCDEVERLLSAVAAAIRKLGEDA